MILDVPFYPGKKYYCAQDCALMVLKFYYPEKEFDIEEISIKSIKHQEYGTMTIGLAKALREYGLNVEFYYKTGEEMNETDRKEFLEKYGEYMNQEKEIRKKAKKTGVKIKEKEFTLKELKDTLNKNKVIISLINWNVLCKKDGYQGHFVVITGYDEKYIYSHNPGPNYPEKNMNILIETMEKARNYPGTNRETILISRL